MAQAIPAANLRTDFLSSVDLKKVYKVPRGTFPLAVDTPSVTAGEADFMRPTDWIIGLTVNGSARAYPAWILDNYHAVNDRLGESNIVVMHCEICCSNAVYSSGLNGRRLIFGTAGLYGGTLAVYDVETGSTWSHGMGVAFDGPLKGASLDRIQSFQASWEEWLSLYPESTVMTWQAPPIHPDGRHGHGSRDTFARPGMYVEPASTMIVGNDNRLEEHEMVVTISSTHGAAAIPLREISRAGGLFQFRIGPMNLVAIGAEPASAIVGIFHRHIAGNDDMKLDFELCEGRATDVQTGSAWRADGVAINGPLKGKELQPFPTMINKWHSLACFLPGITLLKQTGPAPEPQLLEASGAVQAIRNRGFSVAVDHELYSLELPNGAVRGFRIRVDGEPFGLILFADESVARDYGLCQGHSEIAGRLVIESTPARRFKDDLNVQRLADSEVCWSPLLGQERFRSAVQDAALSLPQTAPLACANITTLCRALSDSPYRITIGAECPRDAIPAGAVFGVECSIKGDSFLIFRFERAEEAFRYAEQSQNCIAAGPLVLKSDPEVYVIPRPLSTVKKPDDSIEWSVLLEDLRFKDLVRSAVT